MASAAEQLASNLNFAAFAKAEDLKKRIWFTLGALLVTARHHSASGSIPDAFEPSSSSLACRIFNMFAGGAISDIAIRVK